MERLSRILLVEDDPDISLIVGLAIEKFSAAEGGASLSVCISAEKALDYLREHKPQLMLLDHMMPGLTGLDFLKKIRSAGEKVPVIFITAKTNIANMCHFPDSGVLGVIYKPFDPLTLWNKIKEMYCKKEPTA